MLSDVEMSTIYNGIYSIIQDTFSGMSSDYIENNMDCYNSVIRKCYNLYSNTGSQVIYFTIEDILRREMMNPMSIVFEYACKHGMTTNPLFTNVPIISKHDFVEFSMNRLAFEHEMYGVDRVASEILLYRLTHQILYKLQNKEETDDIDYVICALQSIYDVIRNTDESNNIVCKNGIARRGAYLADNCVSSYVLVGHNNATAGLCVPIIIDMIKHVILAGNFNITQNVIDVLDIPFNIHNINSYYEIYTIVNLFISEYLKNIKSYGGIYYETENEYNTDYISLYNQLVIQTIVELLYAIFDTISFIKTNMDSYYYRDLLYSIYDVIYDTVVIMGIRR